MKKNILILFVVLAVSYLLSPFAGSLDEKLFGGGGTWTDVSSIFGLPLVYILSLAILFTAFGDRHKYWWIGILLIPAVAFEIYFDLGHIYFPMILAILGLAIGLGTSKILNRSKAS